MKILKVLSLVVFGVLLSLGFNSEKSYACAEGGATEGSNAGNTTIFYSPHPDDETLSMGAGIANHLSIGDDVHIVLLTKGGASNAISSVNAKLNPNRITVDEFKEARVREFKLAMNNMGVSPQNIHVYDLNDGGVNKNDVRNIIIEFERTYPKARHKATSYYDYHNDHKALGFALNELHNEQIVSDARFYLSPAQRNQVLVMNESFPQSFISKYNSAIESYNVWMPQNGYYGIGFLSVYGQFQQVKSDMISQVHRPNN